MQDVLKRVKKVMVNEKTNELIVIVDGKEWHGQDAKVVTEGIREKFKKSGDPRVLIVRSEENSSLERLLETHWTFFCGLWRRSFPAAGPWLESCTYSLRGNRLQLEFGSELALHALSDRGFEVLTQRLIKAMSGTDVTVSLTLSQENGYGDAITPPIAEARDEELEEIKRIVKRNNSKQNKTSKNRVIIGKAFRGTPKPIKEVIQDAGTVVVEGDVCGIEKKELNSQKYSLLMSLFITDYEDTIECRLFIDRASRPGVENAVREGDRVRVKGEAQYNKYVKEIVIAGRDAMLVPAEQRKDDYPEKRIELHAHTRFSALDGVAPVEALVEKAAEWGHTAIAITDHGVVQAFPEAYEASQRTGVKVIYGLEGYMIDDLYITSQTGFELDKKDRFVVFDIETTGLDPIRDSITEIGAIMVENGNIADRFHSLINPGVPIPEEIVELTGITDEMVKDCPTADRVIPAFLEFARDAVLVAHNASFDMGFIQQSAASMGMTVKNKVLDTLAITRRLFPRLKTHKLSAVAQHLKIDMERAHRAIDDALVTAKIFIICMKALERERENTARGGGRNALLKETLNRLRSYHVTILAKDQQGLEDLYRLVSSSHLEYFHKTPRIPKSLLLEKRKGLLIGSACEAGELYRGILSGKSDSELEEIASFYDYLEIQPVGNNLFMVESGRLSGVGDIQRANRKVYEIGKKLGIPVVATGDVHFINPRDMVFRKVILAGKGFQDADSQAPLFLHTTSEMLEEFKYLGENAAKEVVIENPNAINEKIGQLIPVPLETYPPTIEGAEQQLEKLTWQRAQALYGSPLPRVVEDRLKRELKSIIGNGYAVLYIAAQKLVSKSNEDGYLVGSRGSVGSSLVATMSGITEVNPLPPHYLCGGCKYSQFIEDGSIGSGADLPDKTCPECGAPLGKHGFDIPFEVFMGFEGDKEPDIDLNFSGEYQARAHRFAEELFGKSKVFRAGTISTLADKTAYGFVKGYLEERNLTVHNAEVNRLVKGCAGIKKTTGQHPGGVMIVPRDMDIHKFTPVQRPADDPNSDVITTHFDYHALSGRLLKLDILGHDDPTMLKMLYKLTGKNPTEIPLDDQRTMQLFSSTQSLGIKPDDIECPVGSLGIPEFGTKFVRQMLQDTKPTTMAELIRISGLSHGTDVWINNAQQVIQEGIATLKEVISTRDDIFLFLIKKGMDPKNAFRIMERVRKGKGLTEGDVEDMRRVGTPDWFIESCNKIKYMFPKAHAVAYVTMAFRIAYYKVHYPLAFYAAYFTVRADEFDAQLIVAGRDRVAKTIREYESRRNNLTQKEKSLLTILEVAREMYCRGFGFMPVDLYKSDAREFLIVGEKLLPPLSALQGLGGNAAGSIVEAKKERPFISVEDLQERARISRAIIDILREHGCLDSLPESNQISLF
jgi:DNA polymerase-3 subunit alpha (Gram-positive type)